MSGFADTWQRIVSSTDQEAAKNEALLVGQLTLKAAKDARFREELQAEPTSVIKREAASLSIEANERVVDAVGKAFSAAIPGADTGKVQELIFETVDDMRRSFKMTLELSRWLFFAGLGMVALAFCAALFSDKLWAIGVSGGGGALSLLLAATMNPLDRIRGAAANLAQVQAAYLAFYKQLYILGTTTETLNRADAISFSEELRKAANAMVESVSAALEKGAAEASAGRSMAGLRGRKDTNGAANQKRRQRALPAPVAGSQGGGS